MYCCRWLHKKEILLGPLVVIGTNAEWTSSASEFTIGDIRFREGINVYYISKYPLLPFLNTNFAFILL